MKPCTVEPGLNNGHSEPNTLTLLIYLCMYVYLCLQVCLWAHTCHNGYVEVRGQLAGFDSVCVPQVELRSSGFATVTFLAAEPSCLSSTLYSEAMSFADSIAHHYS